MNCAQCAKNKIKICKINLTKTIFKILEIIYKKYTFKNKYNYI